MLRSESKVLSALTTFTKEFGDHLRFTEDLQYSNSKSQVPLQPLFEYANVIERNNPLLPASVAALMDANGLADISVGRDGLGSRNKRSGKRPQHLHNCY